MAQNQQTGLPSIASHISTRKSKRDSLDFLPTPPWATRALCLKLGRVLQNHSIWEPACGKLDMARAIREYMTSGEPLICSDIVKRLDDPCIQVMDFIGQNCLDYKVDWTLSNPPFTKALEFILKALEVSVTGVAMLVRTNFLEGGERYVELFSKTPPTRTLQFVERVPMFVDRLDPDGSTMTAYMWLVWQHGCERRPMEWIEPCRSRLERPGDYDQYLQSTPLLGVVS